MGGASLGSVITVFMLLIFSPPALFFEGSLLRLILSICLKNM